MQYQFRVLFFSYNALPVTDMLPLRGKEQSGTDASIHIAPTEQRNLRGRFIATDMLLPTDMLLLTEQRGFVDGRFNTYCSYGAKRIRFITDLLFQRERRMFFPK